METAKIEPNKKQQECINNIKGQYLVLAGPGTGKTFTVAKRIENMIKQGILPEKILCLTFSETAASEMGKKINKELNTEDSGVNIYTYHSFCYEIICDNTEQFELPENHKLLSESVSRKFVNDCMDEKTPVAYKAEKSNFYYYADSIRYGINAIKQNKLKKEEYFYNLEHNVEWKPFLKVIKEKIDIARAKNLGTKGNENKLKEQQDKIAKAIELWDYYELYTQKMEQYHYIDYNDMINLVLDKFESDSGFLSKIANQYEYLLVDEYQDTNKNQNEVLFNLAEGLENHNVFVVGDDDQIVFTFQGARLDTIERFLTKFPDTKVICLKENMRSTQSILDVAREVAKQDSNRLEVNPEFAKYNIHKDLIAKNEDVIKKDKKVRFYKYASPTQEISEIVKEIEQLVNSDDCPIDKEGGKNYSEIAILTKSNAELEVYAEMLKDRNIPYELKEGKNILLIKSVFIMIDYIQMLSNPQLNSEKIYMLLLNPPFNINLKDYETIYEKMSDYPTFIECLRNLKPEDCIDYEKINNFLKVYDYLKNYMANETLHNIVMEIGAKTGIFNYYLNSEINRCENISGLKKLIDVAKEFSGIEKSVSLEDFAKYLDDCKKDDIEIKTDKSPVKMNSVQLSTYHSAKGKEFEYVYMPTLLNTKWEYRPANKPLVPISPEDAKTEDEYKTQKLSDCIKVLYVGMTRAKYTLRLSYFTPSGTKTKLSQFIDSINKEMLEKESEPFEYDEASFLQEINESLIKRTYDYKKDFASLVDMKLKDKKFSPTYLNDYLQCKRQFLYDRILDFSPKAEIPDAMNYGSAVHEACDYIVKEAVKYKEYSSKEEFINKFKENMRELPFSSYKQKQFYLEKGEKALDNFYHHIIDNKISSYESAEKKISLEIDGYEFVGKIDRVDKNEDGTFSIYDYKTGEAKSGREIAEGRNHENYYNQIAFYKYIYEKSTGDKVTKTEFIFPEEPEKPYKINFTEEECELVKDKYLQAIKDIKSYDFAPLETRDKNSQPCKYCGFKDICDLEII